MAPSTKKQDKRSYTSETIKEALRRVKEDGWTIYKDSKQYGIPWSTLKDYVNKFLDNPCSASVSKIEKSFVMPAELEIKIVKYVTTMQDMGFGLTVNQVRMVAFKVVEAAGIKHPFNRESKMAAIATRAHLEDFYDKVESLLNSLGIADKPSRLWNCDEMGLSYVLRSGKIVCRVVHTTCKTVVLFMDSHASHVTPEFLSMAGDNNVHIVTFPSHTTHLLQPLDVGVYRPLKEAWRKELTKFMVQNPGQEPDRYNFNEFLCVAYREAFQATTVSNSFSKTGIFPLNRSKVSDEAIAPSLVTEATGDRPNTEQELAATGVDEVLSLPVSKATAKKPRGDPTTKVLSPKEKASTSKTGQKKNPRNKKEDVCGSCGGLYLEDTKKKNGAKWIQCQFCLVWYHEKCQNIISKLHFMCGDCEISDDSD
ncbi:hypothetical protein ANN_19079 [Periplaneta americana]|uniref:DDE-1 domain-containing protein n=1 Tax=Periplaneta americana TaxID=6978 RepID=A0ABQ8SRS8_PERAM|nr:hypothetical protein ANN_19079 [Periplaneta americana]